MGNFTLESMNFWKKGALVRQEFVRIWIFLEQISINTAVMSLCGWM
jgi:hypothetical protein